MYLSFWVLCRGPNQTLNGACATRVGQELVSDSNYWQGEIMSLQRVKYCRGN